MSSSTLAHHERIKSANDFKRLKSNGKPLFGKHMIYVVTKNGQENSRVGVIVTKKTGNAVIRNKWKRQIREFFRLHKDMFALGMDHLWVVQSKIKSPPPEDLWREMKELAKKHYENNSVIHP